MTRYTQCMRCGQHGHTSSTCKRMILLEIDANRELPQDVTDEVANRVYTMLHAAGVQCDVTARLLKE